MAGAHEAADPSTQLVWGLIGIAVGIAIAKWWRGIAHFLRETNKLWLDNPPGWGTEEQPIGIAVALMWLVAAGWFGLGLLFVIGAIGDYISN